MQAARDHAAGLEASSKKEMAGADEAYMLLGDAHNTVRILFNFVLSV